LTFVVADCAYLASVQARMLDRSVAPPLPAESYDSSGERATCVRHALIFKNYAGSQRSFCLFEIVCVTRKVPHLFSKFAISVWRLRLSVALLVFFVTLFSFQGAVFRPQRPDRIHLCMCLNR